VYWGTTVQGALDEASNAKNPETKQVMVLNKYLGIQKFRDPATDKRG
jgi:hypothetical protein